MAASRNVMYFRFCGWRHVFTLHIMAYGAIGCVEHFSRDSNQILLNDENQQALIVCLLEVRRTGDEVCYVPLPCCRSECTILRSTCRAAVDAVVWSQRRRLHRRRKPHQNQTFRLQRQRPGWVSSFYHRDTQRIGNEQVLLLQRDRATRLSV